MLSTKIEMHSMDNTHILRMRAAKGLGGKIGLVWQNDVVSVHGNFSRLPLGKGLLFEAKEERLKADAA